MCTYIYFLRINTCISHLFPEHEDIQCKCRAYEYINREKFDESRCGVMNGGVIDGFVG